MGGEFHCTAPWSRGCFSFSCDLYKEEESPGSCILLLKNMQVKGEQYLKLASVAELARL